MVTPSVPPYGKFRAISPEHSCFLDKAYARINDFIKIPRRRAEDADWDTFFSVLSKLRSFGNRVTWQDFDDEWVRWGIDRPKKKAKLG